MAGFNFQQGKSNNALAAEREGKITLGRWSKRYGVTAEAARQVLSITEYHHTGTGRRGRTHETYYIEASTSATPEQISRMKSLDQTAREAKKLKDASNYTNCNVRYIIWHGRYGRHWTPQEQILQNQSVIIRADGVIMISGYSGDARKWSGLIIAQHGQIIAENVNRQYDDPQAIATRISS